MGDSNQVKFQSGFGQGISGMTLGSVYLVVEFDESYSEI